jgi:hypothetical protein
MKKMIIMKKLIFMSLLILGSMRLSAQADLGGNALMVPAIVGLNHVGLLTVDVANYGFTDVTAGCALVTISVPSAISSIISVNAATNGIWTVHFNGALPASITLRNTLGIIPADFLNYPIVLDVRGIAVGGPSTITGQVRLAGAFVQPGCLALGNVDITNDDPTTSIRVEIPLAVKLSSFTGVISDCNTLLKWTSQEEIDNKEYQVEVSKDGRIYSVVGVVNAIGNSQTAKSYTFTHNKPFDGYSFYRLKMVANDGHVEYSNIVTVNNKCNDKSVRIYPNPIVENQSLGVYISGAYVGTIKGELMSISGQLMRSFTLQKGTNILAVKGLAQGTYMMRVTEVSTGENESFKVVVIK